MCHTAQQCSELHEYAENKKLQQRDGETLLHQQLFIALLLFFKILPAIIQTDPLKNVKHVKNWLTHLH